MNEEELKEKAFEEAIEEYLITKGGYIKGNPKNFNRELALAYGNPLKEIYADPDLKVSISTNASKADKEGELQRLMQMLNLPIAQMIFSNLQPDQTVLAVKYLMAKAGLTDVDNLLQLQKEDGSPQDITITPDPTAKDIIDASQGDNPQIMG